MSTSTAHADVSSAPLTQRGLAALAIAFALLWFCNLGYRSLVHPDEGRYAEIPREMVASGDWVTPRLDGVRYFEKPPLQYWLTAAAYEAFGVREWTARLWPALAGFLCVLFTGFVGHRLGGPRLGLYSACVLGGSIGYALSAHFLTLDAGLTLWMTIGLGGLMLAQRDGVAAGESRLWMWAAWAALALATLSKGLIGIVLPGASLVLYSLATRDWAVWRRLRIVSGALIFLAVASPWFVAVSLRNPGFLDFFFVHEHFTRFLTSEHHREGAWWYFIPILAVAILPWLSVFAWTAPRLWSGAPATSGFHWQRFALVWSAFIFVFFSASGSKLPSYILPIMPALALLIGWQLVLLETAAILKLIAPLVIATALLTVGALFGFGALAQRLADAKQPLAALVAYGGWIKAAFVVALLGGVAAWRWLALGRRSAAIVAVALSSLAWTQLVTSGFDELGEERSAAPLLTRVASQHGPLRRDLPLYSVKMYDQTVPYYLARTVIPVAHPDELAMGLASEPDKAIDTVDEWKKRWQASDQAYAIMQPEEYELFTREGLPMIELGRDPRRVLVQRR
jgi:4-amino-4-deoxy-L-arabinose transferase-like glycosyltransferase